MAVSDIESIRDRIAKMEAQTEMHALQLSQHTELFEKGEAKFDAIIANLAKMQRALWLIGGALVGQVPVVKDALEKLIQSAHAMM